MEKKQKNVTPLPRPLRDRAEEKVRSTRTDITAMPLGEVQALVYELQIHQIELELQNEELRQTHVALSELRDRYLDLYEFAPVGYVTVDRDGILCECNLTSTVMLGSERRALLGSNLSKFIASQCQDTWSLYRDNTFSSARKQACEVQMRRANGTPWEARLESVVFGSKGTRRCRTVIVDISERKRAEEERERALVLERSARQEAEKNSRAKDQFLAMVSHELRTPLTPILAWSRLLCSEKLEGANQTRALDSIERNASLLSQLIEDLLDISGFIAGKVRLEFQPVDLVGIVNAAINVVRHDADSKTIQIETQFDADAAPLSGDSERLQQVIWNLLSNAIKFTPSGGRITVRLERLADTIEITVIDTGRGISADFLPYVFDPFRQAEEFIAKGRRGLGLGLAIVRQIVQLHGGTIAAASGGEGMGSTFTVAVPTRLTVETGVADSCPQPRSAA